MSISQLVINFRNFLIASWPRILQILEDLDWDDLPYFLDIWIQANWELLVEKQALNPDLLLAPYGYDSSPGCRYSKRGVRATHRVTCHKKGQLEPRYFFLCFVSKVEGAFKIKPPFDFIDVEDTKTGERLSIALQEVEFAVDQIA